jgi:hypothetical protein
MKNRLIILTMMLATPIITLAQANAPETEQISLTVHPAALPSPAMRYHFMSDLVDQTAGNAALLYLNAAQQVAIVRAADPASIGEDQKISQWLAAPMAAFPKDQAQGMVNRYAPALKQMRLASLRDRCDFDPPYRTEGFRTLLPYLVDARSLARLACLSARVKIANGDFDSAVGDLALPIVQCGHLNEGQPILIQLLVAASCAQFSLDQVQVLIAQEHAPNLYWALGDIPSPLANAREIMQMERAGAYFSIPQLKDARSGKMTAEQWRTALLTMTEIRNSTGLHVYGQPSSVVQVSAALMAIKEFPIARQYLFDQKIAPHDVEAMSPSQVLGLYHVGEFEHWTQELDRCLTLPYWQALPLLSRTEDQLRQLKTDNPWSLISVFVPELKTPLTNLARAERRIAMLRTVEAIRAYAASHDGQAPDSLSDLHDAPASIDPMTGKAFVYRKDGDQVTIQGPAIELAAPSSTAIRITLKIVK